MEATIKLFRALPVATREKKYDDRLMGATIRRGFIFAPEVVANYSNYDELIKLVEKTVGLTAEQINSSFHKSWAKVRDTSLEQLVVEQIAHYLTTYGKRHPESYVAEKELQWGVDNLGAKISNLTDIEIDRIQDADYVYIPKEALNIPDLNLGDLKLVVIKGYTKEELKEKLYALLESGIALKEDTIKDVVEVSMFVGLDDFERVKNKEVKSILYDLSGLFPLNPIEFLRYVVFKATGKTLLIKNRALIKEIKSGNNLNIIKLFYDYESKVGIERLAEIFYRFKPIFLAFKTNEQMNRIVNKIRRFAVDNHKPMPVDFLNTVTAMIGCGAYISASKLEHELSRVNIFRKIRLAYALQFRTGDPSSILYRIRNGKSYATEFSFDNKREAFRILNIVLDAIAKDIQLNVCGKKIYIPEYIHYSLPATEKQFTGNFPSGTSVSVVDDMVAGIHWNNVNGHRIDLDLSLISATTGKMGWDGYYRSGDKGILFSGDVTDASGGASELFYARKQKDNAFIVFINYYNFDEDIKVPYKILVAREKVNKNFTKNYMVDPNNVIAITNSIIDKKEKILGLIVTSEEDNKFYFAETNIGKSITSGYSEYSEHSRKFLIDYYTDSIELRDILVRAGADLVEDREDADIDLSPELLEKDSILNLLK